MKILIAIVTVIILTLLSACGQTIVIPADMAVTLPPNQTFILHATLTPPPPPPSITPTPQPTATAPSPTPSYTPTITPTRKPTATRKAPYPVFQGEALIDPGFQAITFDNVQQIKPIFNALQGSRRHSAISADGQKLFLSTSNGTYLFNRQGEILAHWQSIFTADIACESCISANYDGSRLAIMTRNAGMWEAQIYDIRDRQAELFLALPLQPGYKGIENEGSVAISPDNKYLAFRTSGMPLRVMDLESKLQVLEYDRAVNGINFTPDSGSFVIHAGQELLFYKVTDWRFPTVNLLLPRENTPYAFSPDGRLLVIALPTLLRFYAIDGDSLEETLEINIPPSNASNREWQIAFSDAQTLAGYAVRWDTFHTIGTVDFGQWDLLSGEARSLDTYKVNATDALSALWGNPLTLPETPGDLETGALAYPAFRFISDGILLVNSPHSACWLKVFTGETTCFKDAENNLFAADANTYKESRDSQGTSLVELRSQTTTIQVGTYQIVAINRTGEWALIDNGSGTDLYQKGKKLPQESVKGKLQGFGENAELIVFTALEQENSFTITVVEKATGNAIIQKKDNFLYKPVIMTADGTIYYTQNELDLNQTIFNRIDPETQEISEITRISLPARPMVMALSSNGLLAVGQEDGAVLFMPKEGGATTSIQAASSAIAGLSFSPDGRFLAIASAEGVRIFSIFPVR